MTPRNMRYRKDEMRYRKRQKWNGVSLVYVLGAKVKLIHFGFIHNYIKTSKYRTILCVICFVEAISLEICQFRELYIKKTP